MQSGEVVFNTSLTGYQEITTDPSYAGQIVTMTYTQIGNVGVNAADGESRRPFLSGFVVKELFDDPSNYRAEGTPRRCSRRRVCPAIAGIDTRALVRRIREVGAQVGVLSTDPAQQDDRGSGRARAQRPGPRRHATGSLEVTCDAPYDFAEGIWAGVEGQLPRRRAARRSRLKLVAYDFGVKRNILRLLVEQGFDVKVVPATTAAEQRSR